MLNGQRYVPDQLKPLMPPPPPIHPNPSIDRELMREYAIRRYRAKLQIDFDD
jgi:hypothetical protein